MSSPNQTSEEGSSHPIISSLQLKSLDPIELFTKLTAVENALPYLLLCLKPILTRLGSTPSLSLSSQHCLISNLDHSGDTERESERERGEVDLGELAQKSISDYMEILDEIQEVLRNAALYLRKTNTSPTALIPPPPTSIPTPFASTLPPNSSFFGSTNTSSTFDSNSDGDYQPSNEVELGLYASRTESKVLKDLQETFEAMQEEKKNKQGSS